MVSWRHHDPDAVIPPELIDAVRTIGQPFKSSADLDRLMDRIGDAHCVLLGEATHGTREFYTWRAEISKRLILERGFSFVAVEGDWPDCYRVNRYVKNYADSGADALDVLHEFARWPTWMWANQEVASFVEWLRHINEERPNASRVGFYGLDVYSLWESLYQVMSYLRRAAPGAMQAAREAFNCFEPYGEEAQAYARASLLVPNSCQGEVVRLLREVRQTVRANERDGSDAKFVAEQNALVVKNAESYYRTMVLSNARSWNIRDTHMAETLDRLLRHHGQGAKAIVWEHNTHIGDARHTNMVKAGEINLGQLAREQYGMDDVVLVGFGTYTGTVIAADEWDAPMEVMHVPPARDGGWEDVFHRAGANDRLVICSTEWPAEAYDWRGHRAIGVVYHPEFERYGNYVDTVLPRRYDAFLYFEHSHAVHPLHVKAEHVQEAPETYPSGV